MVNERPSPLPCVVASYAHGRMGLSSSSPTHCAIGTLSLSCSTSIWPYHSSLFSIPICAAAMNHASTNPIPAMNATRFRNVRIVSSLECMNQSDDEYGTTHYSSNAVFDHPCPIALTLHCVTRFRHTPPLVCPSRYIPPRIAAGTVAT